MKTAHHIFIVFTAFAGGFASNSLVNFKATKNFQASKIIDGDSLEIDNFWQTHIRLNAIDAPEKKRPFYREAAHMLETYCLDKKSILKNTADGGFGRTAADVYCEGLFVNRKMIEMGLAIVSIKHATDISLYELQDKARQKCRGIWAHDITKIYDEHKLEGKSSIASLTYQKFTNNPDCKIKLALN